nr:MAG TPA: hypothetical protein [Caudoviricetes sp.]
MLPPQLLKARFYAVFRGFSYTKKIYIDTATVWG